MHIATENISLCADDELAAFVELESAIRAYDELI
jgi:hypothetical protein